MKTILSHARSERTTGGFTLVEVLLALGILMLGMSVILGLLSFGAALSRTAALRTAAAQAIDGVVADLEEELFPLEPDGTVGDPIAIEHRELAAHPDVVYSARAVPNPADPDQFRVDVEVSWSVQGARRKKRFSTLMTRSVPFGERLRRELFDEEEPARAEPEPAPPTDGA